MEPTARLRTAGTARPIEGIGVELRYEWNVDLRVSEMFKSWEALEAADREAPQRPGGEGPELAVVWLRREAAHEEVLCA